MCAWVQTCVGAGGGHMKTGSERWKDNSVNDPCG